MTSKHIAYALLLSTALLAPAAAQNPNQNTQNPPPAATNPPPAASNTTAAAPMKHTGQWRASKMIGLNVYNDQNEKLGDINEILMDNSGKVVGYVLGVGGFLGMGEHDILVQPDKLKFVNEPVRTSSTASAPRTNDNRPAADNRATTGTAANNPNNRPARAADEKWYPDHAMLSATKDQLKSMPQFKYSSYN
jgi:hypothetical protein